MVFARVVQRPWFVVVVLLAGLVLAACTVGRVPSTVVVTVEPSPEVRVVTPTPPPPPPPVLVLCYGQEPRSLYLYSGQLNLTAWNLLELLYDGPIDYREYQDVPVILERLPSLENGDAVIEPVTVRLGDTIVDADGRVVRLQPGVRYRPAGCTSDECVRTLGPDEEEAVLDRLTVRFRLRRDVRWSDAWGVTAEDSVFSYQLARTKGSTPLNPWLLDRTASYRAVDTYTVEWQGLPGFVNNTYWRNFWSPLPRHRLKKYALDEIASLEDVHRRPLGWGAYQLAAWEPGKRMEFVPNPYYFRQDEGLPRFTKVVVRFFDNPEEGLAALMTGECDFVSETVGLEHQTKLLFALEDSNKVQVSLAPGPAFEHLGFVLYNQALDDGLQYRDPGSPLYDEKVRKAVAMCIDKEAIIQEVYGGFVQAYTSYLPPDHPAFAGDQVPTYPYDPQEAQRLLEEAGWVDHDQDPTTPRVFRQSSLWVRYNQPLELTLGTTQAPLRQKVAQRIAEDLDQCGIRVKVQTYPAQEFFATGPEGPVFGRRLDMALFAWTLRPEIMCQLWMTEAIPGPPEATIDDVLWLRRIWPEDARGRDAFLYDWAGWNYHAYSDPEFDAACRQVLFGLPDTPAYRQAWTFTQVRLAERVPLVPLYTQMKMVAMRADFCGYTPDPGSPLELRDVEAFGYGDLCPAGAD